MGEKFSLETPLAAPGADATPKEQQRWALYCDWLAAQNITLEEYAMRVRGASRDTAARLASEVTLRTVAAKGTDEAAEEAIAEKGQVRAELDGGAREIEIELADMATYVAIADYQSENDNELSFKEGEQVIVLGPDDSGWWKAELNGQFGWVPAAFFERVHDKKAQVAPEMINEAELAGAELATAVVKVAPAPADELAASSSSASLAAAAKAEAAAAAAAAEKEPSLADDGEVMYTQAIEDFSAEGEGELGFRRDDYVCVLKPEADDGGGWWKGQLPTGEFGWVPAEFLEVLPAKPKDWANRVPASKSRATVKVDGLLQGNVANEIREMEACEARWGAVAAKFGKLWTKDASPANVVTGGADSDEWRQRFCVLLKKERRLLELRSWQDEPTAALASHHVATSLSSTHAARSFAFFVRTRKTAVLLAPIAADKEARIERDEWLAAIGSVTKETLKAKRGGGSSSKKGGSGASRSRSGSSAGAVALKDAVLQGKLQKKSFGWSSRWFALLSTGRLQWWDSATAATAGKPSKSSMSLVGAHVGKPPNAGRHHAFYVKTAADSLLLRAKSAGGGRSLDCGGGGSGCESQVKRNDKNGFRFFFLMMASFSVAFVRVAKESGAAVAPRKMFLFLKEKEKIKENGECKLHCVCYCVRRWRKACRANRADEKDS
jgi:growth factor receptor-binding protein 2